MTTRHEESYDAMFEAEMLRLAKENNRLLQAIDEKLRKILQNTSNFWHYLPSDLMRIPKPTFVVAERKSYFTSNIKAGPEGLEPSTNYFAGSHSIQAELRALHNDILQTLIKT